jgi:hypothetical protein
LTTQKKVDFRKMTGSAIFPCLLFLIIRFPIVASYFFNIDTDLDSSYKTTFFLEGTASAYQLDASQDFNNDGFNDILVGSDSPFLYFGGNPVFPATPSVEFTGSGGLTYCQFAGDVNKDNYADVICGYFLILGGQLHLLHIL